METRSNKPWSAKEMQILLDLSAAGVPREDIGLRLGRTSKAVEVKLNKLRGQVKRTKEAVVVTDAKPFDLTDLFGDVEFGDERESLSTIVDAAFAEADEVEAEVKTNGKPKHYLYNAPFENKEHAKAMGARWDNKCWFVPDTLTGEDRKALIDAFGPTKYGYLDNKSKHKWLTFVPVDEPSPDRMDVKPKPKRVTQKKANVAVKATGNQTTAVGSPTVAVGNSTAAQRDADAHVYIIRVPKVLVAAVLVSVLVAAAWYVGKTY